MIRERTLCVFQRAFVLRERHLDTALVLEQTSENIVKPPCFAVVANCFGTGEAAFGISPSPTVRFAVAEQAPSNLFEAGDSVSEICTDVTFGARHPVSSASE